MTSQQAVRLKVVSVVCSYPIIRLILASSKVLLSQAAEGKYDYVEFSTSEQMPFSSNSFKKQPSSHEDEDGVVDAVKH